MRRYWEDPARYPIDPSRIDLAKEFRDNIRGPHSEELRYILHRMRATPVRGKFVLVIVEPYRKWRIGRIGQRGKPIQIVDKKIYEDLDRAEWEVFKLRWRELTGRTLRI